MFLNFVRLITLFIIVVVTSATAHAKKIESLQAGNYVLKSGPEERCLNFKISPKKMNGKSLILATLYGFNTEPSESSIPSDIDPKCIFKERTSREDMGARQTILKSVNQEVCAGKLKSQNISIATISRNEIIIKHKIGNQEAYQCVYNKRD